MDLDLEERVVSLDERKLALEQGKMALEQEKSRMEPRHPRAVCVRAPGSADRVTQERLGREHRHPCLG